MKKLLFFVTVVLATATCHAQQGQGESGGKPPDSQPVVISDLNELHRYLVGSAAENKFSGVVLMAKGGDILFQEACGLASKSLTAPNKMDTKFNLGSINKLFTAIALLQLAEKGLLSMDDPIGKYLDVFPPEIADSVKIIHLLTMQSGWGDYWDNDYFKAHRSDLRTVSDYMQFIKDMPLDFKPGTNAQHSNTGFEVAGAIIEKVTGVDYYEYIRKHIYEPMGMSNTGSYHTDSTVDNIAIGYTNENPYDFVTTDYTWSNTHLMPPRGTPAGGGYSTAEDLLKFAQGLRGNILLSPGYTNYLLNGFQGKPGDPILPMLLKGVWRSVGGAQGISAVLGMDLKDGYSYIVLSNYDFPAAYDVFQLIYKLKL